MTNIVPKFVCHVDNSELHMEGHIKDSYVGYLKTLPDGFYDLTVKKHSIDSPRSSQQNRYLWGVVYEILSEELGYTVDDIHEIMKGRFLSKPMRLWGEEDSIHRSTTELNTIEMEKYLEDIRMLAAENGINIPEPHEVE